MRHGDDEHCGWLAQEDVDAAMLHPTQVSLQQEFVVKGVTIVAHAAGRTLGGCLWRLKKETVGGARGCVFPAP